MFRSRHLRRVVFSIACLTLMGERAARAQDVVPPHLVQPATPEFPEGEAADRSRVTVALVIAPDGSVTDATILTSGGDAFDRAALSVAKDMKFEPAKRGDTPVQARIAFNFDFERPAPAPASSAPALPAPPPAALPAPAPPAKVEAEEPEELDVRGERPPREATTRVLTGEEIRTAAGTNGDVLRSVENLPGVGRPAGLDGDLIIRGAAPGDSGTFLDGTWIIGSRHFGGITSVVPGELVQKLEFHPGNFSPEYGRLMGGIVELELRSPRKDRIGGLLQVDLLDARTLIEGPISKKTRFAAAARRSWIDAWLGAAGGKAIVSAPVYYDYQGMLEHDVSRNVTARLTVFGSDDRMKLLFDSPDAQDPSGGTLGTHESFVRVQGRVDARLSDDVRWVNKVSWGPNIQRFTEGEYLADVKFDVLQVRSDLRARLSDGAAVVGGADVMYGDYDVKLKFPAVPDGEATGPLFARPAPLVHGEGTVNRPAAYALLELRPFQRLLLVPGVRADYMSDTGRWTVDPRASVRFDVVPGRNRTTLKGAAGLFRQAPDPSQSFAAFGTAGIRSAYAEHYSLGMEQTFGGLAELSVEGFAKRIHQIIVAVPDETATNTGLRNENSGSGRAFGVEWMLKYTGKSRFSGFLSYTLSRSERRDTPDEAYRLFSYDQTHILAATASYDLGRGWRLGSRFRYVSGVPYTPTVGSVADFDAGAYSPVLSPRRDSARVSAFHHLDVRIEKMWNLDPVRLSAYLDVQNVYNQQAEEGRAYSYNYAQSKPLGGLPILPILGVRGEL